MIPSVAGRTVFCMMSFYPSGSGPRVLACSISAIACTMSDPFPTIPHDPPRRIGMVNRDMNCGSKSISRKLDGRPAFTFLLIWRQWAATHVSLNHHWHFLQYRCRLFGEENTGSHLLHPHFDAFWEFCSYRQLEIKEKRGKEGRERDVR